MRWYDKEEEYLHRMQEMCVLLSQKYMNLYIVTHRTQTKLRLPAIILSSCSGVASFGSSSFSASTMKNISIVVGVVNVGIAILQTYESYLKIGDIVSKSLSASQSLKKLADDIQCEIFIPLEDRSSNGITFLRDCFSRYQAILEQAPPMEELTNAKILRIKLNNEIEKQNKSQRESYTHTLLDSIPENQSVRNTESGTGSGMGTSIEHMVVPIPTSESSYVLTRQSQRMSDTPS